MKRRNLKLLVCLIACVGMLACGLHWLHGYQVGRQAGRLLQRASEAEEQGRYEDAAKHLKTYLGFVPQDSAALEHLAFALEKTARSRQGSMAAISVYEQVLRRCPDRQDIRRRLVRFALQCGLTPLAVEHLKTLRQAGAADGELPELLEASQLMRQGQWGESVRILDHIRSQLAGSPELARQVNLLLGRCYQRLGEPSRALGLYRQALEIDPEWVPARWELAVSLIEIGRPDEAILELQQLVAQPDAPLAGVMILARLLLIKNLRMPAGQRDWREFDRVLAEAENVRPNSVELLIVRADGLAARGELAQAYELVRRGIEQHSDRLDLWLESACLLSRMGQTDEALTTLRLAESKFESTAARLTIARGYESVGRLELAMEGIQAVLEAQPHEPSILWFVADFYLRHALTAQAERVLHVIIDGEKRLPKELVAWARRGLAVIMVSRSGASQLQEAVRLIQQNIAASGPSADDQRALAVVLATGKDCQNRREAIRILEELNERQPPSQEENLLLARLYETEGDWSKARRQWLSFVAGGEVTSAYAIFFVECLLRHGEADEALFWLDRFAVPEAEARWRLLLRAADLLAFQGRADDAAKVYQQVLEHDAQNVVALNNLAWLWGRDSLRAADALAMIERAIGLAGPKPELLDTRAVVRLALQQSDQALSDLQAAVEKSPSAARYFHLARAYQKSNYPDAARATLQLARDSGLSQDSLHPTEREDYDSLLQELE